MADRIDTTVLETFFKVAGLEEALERFKKMEGAEKHQFELSKGLQEQLARIAKATEDILAKIQIEGVRRREQTEKQSSEKLVAAAQVRAARIEAIQQQASAKAAAIQEITTAKVNAIRSKELTAAEIGKAKLLALEEKAAAKIVAIQERTAAKTAQLVARHNQMFVNVGNQMSGIAHRAFTSIVNLSNVFWVFLAKRAFDAVYNIGSEFQKGMLEIKTILDDSAGDFKKFTDDVIAMGRRIPFAYKDITEAIYHALSSGIKGADVQTFIAQAAQNAQAGVSTLEESTKTLIYLLNAYGMKAKDATHLSDMLFAAIKVGEFRMGQLADSIGRVASTARMAGVGINETLAALSVTTIKGLPIEESVTGLNQMFMRMLKPGKFAEAIAKEFQIPFTAQQLKGKSGLLGYLEAVDDALQKNGKSLGKLQPNLRGFRTNMMLLGDGLILYKKYLDEITNSNGAAARAADTMSLSIRNQVMLLKNNVQSALIGMFDENNSALAKYIRNINNRFDELRASIISGSEGMVEKIADLIRTFGNFLWLLKDVAYVLATMWVFGKISSFIGWVGKAATAITGFAATVGTANSALAFFATTAGLVVTAVGAIAAGLTYYFYKSMRNAQEATERFTAALDENYNKMLDLKAVQEGYIDNLNKIRWAQKKEESNAFPNIFRRMEGVEGAQAADFLSPLLKVSKGSYLTEAEVEKYFRLAGKENWPQLMKMMEAAVVSDVKEMQSDIDKMKDNNKNKESAYRNLISEYRGEKDMIYNLTSELNKARTERDSLVKEAAGVVARDVLNIPALDPTLAADKKINDIIGALDDAKRRSADLEKKIKEQTGMKGTMASLVSRLFAEDISETGPSPETKGGGGARGREYNIEQYKDYYRRLLEMLNGYLATKLDRYQSEYEKETDLQRKFADETLKIIADAEAKKADIQNELAQAVSAGNKEKAKALSAEVKNISDEIGRLYTLMAEKEEEWSRKNTGRLAEAAARDLEIFRALTRQVNALMSEAMPGTHPAAADTSDIEKKMKEETDKFEKLQAEEQAAERDRYLENMEHLEFLKRKKEAIAELSIIPMPDELRAYVDDAANIIAGGAEGIFNLLYKLATDLLTSIWDFGKAKYEDLKGLLDISASPESDIGKRRLAGREEASGVIRGHPSLRETGQTGAKGMDYQTPLDKRINEIQSAWKNWYSNGRRVIQNFASRAPSFFKSILDAIRRDAPKFLNELMQKLPGILATALPALVDGAIAFLNSLLTYLPSVMAEVAAAITRFMIMLWPPLIRAIPDIVVTFINTVIELIPEIVAAMIVVLPEIIAALIEMIPRLIDALWKTSLNLLRDMPRKVFKAIVRDLSPEWREWFAIIGQGMWKAAQTFTDGIFKGMKEIVDWIKKQFGGGKGGFISSTSKFFGDLFSGDFGGAWKDVEESDLNPANWFHKGGVAKAHGGMTWGSGTPNNFFQKLFGLNRDEILGILQSGEVTWDKNLTQAVMGFSDGSVMEKMMKSVVRSISIQAPSFDLSAVAGGSVTNFNVGQLWGRDLGYVIDEANFRLSRGAGHRTTLNPFSGYRGKR